MFILKRVKIQKKIKFKDFYIYIYIMADTNSHQYFTLKIYLDVDPSSSTGVSGELLFNGYMETTYQNYAVAGEQYGYVLKNVWEETVNSNNKLL